MFRCSRLTRLFSQGSGLSRLNHVTRFYKEVNVVKSDEDNQYIVLLDKRRLKTPDGHLLTFPSYYLANLVAREFDLQEDYIRTSSMPLFGLSKSAIDLENSQLLKNNSYKRLRKFVKNDTISYRDPAGPIQNVQNELLDPIYPIIQEKFGLKLKKNASFFESTLEDDEEGDALLVAHLDSLVSFFGLICNLE